MWCHQVTPLDDMNRVSSTKTRLVFLANISLIAVNAAFIAMHEIRQLLAVVRIGLRKKLFSEFASLKQEP